MHFGGSLRNSRDRGWSPSARNEERQDEQDEGRLVLGPVQTLRAGTEPVRTELSCGPKWTSRPLRQGFVSGAKTFALAEQEPLSLMTSSSLFQ